MKCPECGFDKIRYLDVINKRANKKLICPHCKTPLSAIHFISLVFGIGIFTPFLLLELVPEYNRWNWHYVMVISLTVGGALMLFLYRFAPLLNTNKKLYRVQRNLFWLFIFTALFCWLLI